tara:strand:+ start:1146 stop:1283 length:138 start_codon:yes stop_codon:yes gene_type:complete
LAQLRKQAFSKLKNKKKIETASKGHSPYEGIFEMKVEKLQHKKEF